MESDMKWITEKMETDTKRMWTETKRTVTKEIEKIRQMIK